MKNYELVTVVAVAILNLIKSRQTKSGLVRTSLSVLLSEAHFIGALLSQVRALAF